MVSNLVYYVVPGIVVLYVFRKIKESQWGWCKNNVKLRGKVAIVTGANCGIGYEVALGLLQKDALVIFACRSVEKGLQAIANLEKQHPELKDSKKVCLPLDLSSISSIKSFAKEVTAAYPKIDILVNNAGVSYPDGPKIFTSDGFEIHFGVNHLGHYLLTQLLLPKLERGSSTEHTRVVIVSSRMHEKGAINFDNLNLETQDISKKGYSNSKLANVYFGKELAKTTQGKGINIYIACPGWVYSSLFRHHTKMLWKYLLVLIPAAFLFMRNAKQGAQTILYCATDPSIEGESGQIYRDCTKYKSKHVFDDITAKKLWQVSEEMLLPFKDA